MNKKEHILFFKKIKNERKIDKIINYFIIFTLLFLLILLYYFSLSFSDINQKFILGLVFGIILIILLIIIVYFPISIIEDNSTFLRKANIKKYKETIEKEFKKLIKNNNFRNSQNYIFDKNTLFEILIKQKSLDGEEKRVLVLLRMSILFMIFIIFVFYKLFDYKSYYKILYDKFFGHDYMFLIGVIVLTFLPIYIGYKILIFYRKNMKKFYQIRLKRYTILRYNPLINKIKIVKFEKIK